MYLGLDDIINNTIFGIPKNELAPVSTELQAVIDEYNTLYKDINNISKI